MLKTGVVPESTPEKHQFKIPAFEKTSSTCRKKFIFHRQDSITLLMFKKQDMSSFQEEFCSV